MHGHMNVKFITMHGHMNVKFITMHGHINVKFNTLHGHMNVKFITMHGHMNVKFFSLLFLKLLKLIKCLSFCWLDWICLNIQLPGLFWLCVNSLAIDKYLLYL